MFYQRIATFLSFDNRGHSDPAYHPHSPAGTQPRPFSRHADIHERSALPTYPTILRRAHNFHYCNDDLSRHVPHLHLHGGPPTNLSIHGVLRSPSLPHFHRHRIRNLPQHIDPHPGLPNLQSQTGPGSPHQTRAQTRRPGHRCPILDDRTMVVRMDHPTESTGTRRTMGYTNRCTCSCRLCVDRNGFCFVWVYLR